LEPDIQLLGSKPNPRDKTQKSLNRLLVHYRKPNGRMAVGVNISPRDKAGFLQKLRAKAPDVIVKGDATS
jgi:hypothetical protein